MIKKFLISLFIISHLLLLTQNYSYIIEGYKTGFNIWDLYQTLWDLKYTFNIYTLWLFIIMSLLMSANVAMLWQYYVERGKLIIKYNKNKNIFALTLSILGIGCASCGAVALSLLLGILGVSAASLPLHGAEIGIAGVSLLSYSTYQLYKLYKSPNIC